MAIITKEDEQWLANQLKDCFKDSHEFSKKDIRLQGFSAIIRHMVKNMDRSLVEIIELYKKDPGSDELERKFTFLKKSLFYLERYCGEKIK